MADVEHNALTGSSLHEPKGADGASNNTTYVANGGGSGSWTKIGPDQLDTTVKNVNLVHFTHEIEDVSSAGSHWVVCPIAGDITGIACVIDGALGTADAGLSFEIGGTAVTGGNITITQSGSAAGDVDTATPTANNTLTANQAIEIITDGASTNTVKATITFTIDVS